MDERSVQRARALLTKVGLLRVEKIRRGDTLPSGIRASNHVQKLTPVNPGSLAFRGDKTAAAEGWPGVTGFTTPEAPLTPLTDQREVEEEDRARAREGSASHARSSAPIQDPGASWASAARILDRWRERCDPKVDLEHPPSHGVVSQWTAIIRERLQRFEEGTCVLAIEGAIHSRHNRERGRAGRSVYAIFGSDAKVEALASVGLEAESSRRADRRSSSAPEESPPMTMEESLQHARRLAGVKTPATTERNPDP
jgi:hypothetical protein